MISRLAVSKIMPDIDWLRALCRSFPDVTEDMPWADDLCFKVRGKIFATAVLSDGRCPRVTFKCTPERFHELLEIEGIARAAYVGRYHWVTLADSNILPGAELETLIRKSYEMVEANSPNAANTGKKKSKSNGKRSPRPAASRKKST